MSDPSEVYQSVYGVRFVDKLGEGKDGHVFKTEVSRAVKFFYDGDVYKRELRAYETLRELKVEAVNGFQVPLLIRSDDSLRALEMTIVQPPFVLDFASAYTEEEYAYLDFPQEVLDEREAHWAEAFGDRWPTVKALADAFTAATGLILLDLSVNNVKFE
jgi:hypothetical protein